MRLTAILALVPLAAAILACDRPRSGGEWHERHTFPAAPNKLVRVQARSLDVVVGVADTPEIVAEVHLAARATSKAQATRWLARQQPRFDDTPDTLTVSVPRSRGVVFVGWASTRGTIALTIPPSCRLEVSTVSGDVTLRGDASLADKVRIETRSGDLDVRGGASAVVVESVSGDVEIGETRLALLDVRTTSGDVRLRSGCVRTLVETTSGDCRLEGLAGELSVVTTSGDVRAGLDTLAPANAVRVTSTSGNITLLLPDLPFSGVVRTTSGRIRSRFEGRWGRRQRELIFTAAEEAALLEVRSVSGDIVLHRR